MLKVRYTLIEVLIWSLTAFLYACFSITVLEGSWSTLSLLLITASVAVLTLLKFGFKGFTVGAFQNRILIFACYSFVSSLWAINANDAIERGLTVIELCVCMTIFMWSFNNFRDPYNALLKAVMYGGYIVVAYSYIFAGINTLITVTLLGGRMEGAFDNVNAISLICSFSLILSLYFMLKEKRYIIYLILNLPTIVLFSACGSRKSLVVALVGCFSVFILNKQINKKKNFVLKIIAGLAVFISLLLFLSQLSVFSGIVERMTGLFALFTGDEIDHSTFVRGQMAELGFATFKEHPLLGIGMSNAHILCYKKLGLDCYLHNNYAELLADGGIIGTILYYSIHIDIILRLKKYGGLKSTEGYLVLIIILCLLLSDLSMVSFYAKNYYFFFMIFYVYINYLKKRHIWERTKYL